MDLMIEAHSRFSVAPAVRMPERLAPLRPAWLEEPVPHHHVAAVVEAARRSPVPAATGGSHTDRYVHVGDAPGLGVEVDWEALAAHPYRPDNVLRLFEPHWEQRTGQGA